MRRFIRVLLLVVLAACLPCGLCAQIAAPRATWDLMVGWQRSLAPLMEEVWDVRRTSRFSIGFARSLRSDRAVLWRAGAELTSGSLVVKEKGARDGYDSERREYSVYVEAAPRLLRSLSDPREIDLRVYVGVGWRWIQRPDMGCSASGGRCFQAAKYNERLPDPVGRLGILASYRREEFMTRLDAGYRISTAWAVAQHDLSFRLALVLPR